MALIICVALSGCNSAKAGKDVAPSGQVNYTGIDGTPQTILLAAGAGLISGIVVDEAGNPIASAHVALLGTDQAAVTTTDGLFQFLNLAKGKFTIRVDSEGHKSVEAPISVRAGSVTAARVTLVPLPPPSEEAIATPQSTAAIPYAREWAMGAFVAGCILMIVLGWWLRGHPNRLLRRAEAGLKAGKLEEAERLVRRVLRRIPDNASAWFLLGAVLIKRNEYRQAIRELEAAAAKQDPSMAGLAFLISLSHNRLGQPDQARRWLPLVARDLDYWNALRDNSDSLLMPSARRAPAAPQLDPAYG